MDQVLRVEMQSMKDSPVRPASATVSSTFRYIVRTSGVRGLFRGVVPRIGVAAQATICMVGLGEIVREHLAGWQKNNLFISATQNIL